MAGSAVIGALRVVLGADTASLEKGLKDARSGLSRFAADASKIAAGIGLERGIERTVSAFVGALKQGFVQADKLGKMAQKVGVPVEELSALKHAADLSDVSLESLQKNLGKLSRAMVDAAAKPAGEAATQFRALGVSVTGSDGKLKSSSEVMADVAGKFSGLKDGASKTAMAMALFGKSGADLIPMLNSGKAGLTEMVDEAKAFGLVIDNQTAVAAERFNDNLTRLGKVQDGIALQVTAKLAPALAVLSDRYVALAKDGELVKNISTSIMSALDSTVFIVGKLGLQFQRTVSEINAGIKILKGLATFDRNNEVAEGIAEWTAAGEKFRSGVTGMRTDLDKFWEDSKNKAKEWAAQTVKPAKEIASALLAGKNALDAFLDSTNKRAAAMMSEVQTIGLGAFAREKLRIALEAETIAKDKNITITEKLRQRIEEVGAAYALMADKIEGKRIWEQTRTAAEQFALTMEDLNGKFSRGALDADTYARAVAQAQDKLVAANEHAQNFGRSLETAFDKALDGGTKLGDILKSLILDFAKMEARSAFKSLLHGNAGSGGTSGGLLGSLFGAFGGSAMPAGATGVVGAAGSMVVPTFASGGIIPPGGLALVSEHAPGGGRFIRAGSEPITVSPHDIGEPGGHFSISMPVTVHGDNIGDPKAFAAAIVRQAVAQVPSAVRQAQSRRQL